MPKSKYPVNYHTSSAFGRKISEEDVEKSKPYVNSALVQDVSSSHRDMMKKNRSNVNRSKNNRYDAEARESEPLLPSKWLHLRDKGEKNNIFTVAFVSVIIGLLFICVLGLAIHHGSGGALLFSDTLFDRTPSGNSSLLSPKSYNIYNELPIIIREVVQEKGGEVKVCTVPAQGEWNNVERSTCQHELAKISVLANNLGKWPKGFSWTIMKDDFNSAGMSKSFIASVKDAGAQGKEACDMFITDLCLNGDYVIYANSDEGLEEAEVRVCDKVLRAGEALDFSTENNYCFLQTMEKSFASAAAADKINLSTATSYGPPLSHDVPTAVPTTKASTATARPPSQAVPSAAPTLSAPLVGTAATSPSTSPTLFQLPKEILVIEEAFGNMTSKITNSTLYKMLANSTGQFINKMETFPTAAPTPAYSPAPTVMTLYNATDGCYSLPFLGNLYCPDMKKSEAPSMSPTSVPTAGSNTPVKCALGDLYCSDERDSSRPTSSPTKQPAFAYAEEGELATEDASAVEAERAENFVDGIASYVKLFYSTHFGSSSESPPPSGRPQASRDDAVASSAHEQEKVRMMSLNGATQGSNYNVCMSKYKHDMSYLHVDVPPGCVSLFTNDVSRQMLSMVTTFCGCDNIGPKRFDFIALQRSGLISKDGAGMISYIATGDDISLVIFNSPSFALEPGDSPAKMTIGPNARVSLVDLKMDPEVTWNNAVYSIVIEAWSACDLPPVPCSSETTQAPVSVPTASPSLTLENEKIEKDRKAREFYMEHFAPKTPQLQTTTAFAAVDKNSRLRRRV